MAHSRPIPRIPCASLSRTIPPLRLPRDHFLTRPGSHLFSGWPRATIRDLSIVLLLRRISPYTFRIYMYIYPRNLRPFVLPLLTLRLFASLSPLPPSSPVPVPLPRPLLLVAPLGAPTYPRVLRLFIHLAV